MSVGLSGTAGALTRTVTICNQRGLHARAAARFVKLAATFDAEVTVERNGQSVGGQSIMGLMMLAAGIGSEVTVATRGREATAALEALTELVRRGFDED